MPEKIEQQQTKFQGKIHWKKVQDIQNIYRQAQIAKLFSLFLRNMSRYNTTYTVHPSFQLTDSFSAKDGPLRFLYALHIADVCPKFKFLLYVRRKDVFIAEARIVLLPFWALQYILAFLQSYYSTS